MFCSNDARIKLTLMIQNIITYNVTSICVRAGLLTTKLK